MSNCPNANEQDKISLAILAEQQKNEKATKSKNKLLKQTHHKNLAESFKSINRKITEVNESLEK